MAAPRISIRITPGTNRYYVVIRWDRKNEIALGRNFGWPTYDEAMVAAEDWLREHSALTSA